MQTVMILLVESGLVFLVFQVSRFIYYLPICLRKIFRVLTVLTDVGHSFG